MLVKYLPLVGQRVTFRHVLSWAFFLLSLPGLSAQNLTGTDESDLYRQNVLIKKGDRFVFNDQNTIKRNKLAAFEDLGPGEEFPAFKVEVAEREQEIFFFRLRHPLRIEPYTKYELSFEYLASDFQSPGPYLAIAGYDNTRETEVESNRIVINTGGRQWKKASVTFISKHKTRYARLIIKSQAGGSGKVLIKNTQLKQLSEPQAFKREPIPVFEGSIEELIAGEDSLFSTFELPDQPNYFALSLDLAWTNFEGEVPLQLDWFSADSTGPAPVVDLFNISDIEGILPQWNGLAVRWKRRGPNSVSVASRQLEKRFNQHNKGGDSRVLFYLDRPANVTHVLIRSQLPGILHGTLEWKQLSFTAYP